jgi:hypothetical protein
VRGVHGVGEPDLTERLDGHVHRVWRDVAGRVVIEEYAVAGLGHGTPIATSGDEACGIPGGHMLDAGISSTYRIAASWGIVPVEAPARDSAPAGVSDPAAVRRKSATALSFDAGQTINDALRAAGLIRS